MTIKLRPYQAVAEDAIFAHWAAGRRNVLLKSATGTGKTVVIASTVRRLGRPSAVIAHRGELVSQVSTALASNGVRHRLVGADGMIKTCVSLHMEHFGRSWFDPSSKVGVCSIDTLTRRDAKDAWFDQVGLWVCDEAHHLLKENKWGRGVAMFPNALGLGPTATPCRADGQGLGADNDGVFDVMVEGPEMRAQINAGYLTDYRIHTVPSDVDYSQVTVTASGDLSPVKLKAAVHASGSIVGDVVKHYQRLAPGKRGVTFAVDVEEAVKIATAFRAAGVAAEVVSAKTPDLLRDRILRQLAAGTVQMVVNVDLFGEGFDLPAIEVVIMVRKTESWPLYVQQFGRALRVMVDSRHREVWGDYTDEQRLSIISTSAKPRAIIIDHVGNVIRHGLPDAPRKDTLERRGARASEPSDTMPLRVCCNINVGGTGETCAERYERFLKCCPYCGFYPEPAVRNDPEFVEGDLTELDDATLAAMRGEVLDLDAPPPDLQFLGAAAQGGARKNHERRTDAQQQLRDVMALWAGWQRHLGRDDSYAYRLFNHTYGVDVLTAQSKALTANEALTLAVRIRTDLDANGVTEA